jgi:Transposase, Mutator family
MFQRLREPAYRNRRFLGSSWRCRPSMKTWMEADVSGLDILVVQIDGIHITEHLVLVAAVGIDGEGIKHPLGLMEGATENAAVVQALIDNLVARGLDPTQLRLFIIDGSKALSSVAIRSMQEYIATVYTIIKKGALSSLWLNPRASRAHFSDVLYLDLWDDYMDAV